MYQQPRLQLLLCQIGCHYVSSSCIIKRWRTAKKAIFSQNVFNTYRFELGMDRITGSVSGIRRYPAIFQLSGIRPDTGYPANQILIRLFYSCLKIGDVSIIWVTLSNNEQTLKYPVSGFENGRISGRPDIWQYCYPVHPYKKVKKQLCQEFLIW